MQALTGERVVDGNPVERDAVLGLHLRAAAKGICLVAAPRDRDKPLQLRAIVGPAQATKVTADHQFKFPRGRDRDLEEVGLSGATLVLP